MTQIAYEFLFTFHSNYGAILYHLGDIATYWQKIAKFLYLTASEVFQVQCSEFCPFRYTYGTCVSLSPAPDPVQYIISFLALVVHSGVIGSRNGEGNRLKGMAWHVRCVQNGVSSHCIFSNYFVKEEPTDHAIFTIQQNAACILLAAGSCECVVVTPAEMSLTVT